VSALRYTRQLNTNGELNQKFRITAENGDIYYSVSDRSSKCITYLKNKIDKDVIVKKKIAADMDGDISGTQDGYSKVNPDVTCQYYEAYFTQNAAIGGATILLETIRSNKIYKITIVPTSGRIYLYEINR
ncbi:MAG: hypothetical protein WBH44_06630, partial [Proteocatella sp.]